MVLLDPPTYCLLAGAAFAAGFVDSIAGGGGVITLPALLAAGLPPQLALGTNKLQSSFGSLTAMLRYSRAGLVELRSVILPALCSFLAAFLGAASVSVLDPSILKRIIPVLLLAIVIFLAVSPAFGKERHKEVAKPRVFWVVAGLALGFYDGFFGPGTGTMWTIAIVAFLGYELISASAHTKVMNFSSNLASLVLFSLAGSTMVPLGITMGVSQALGAVVGTGVVLRSGTKFLRYAILAVSLVLSVWIFFR